MKILDILVPARACGQLKETAKRTESYKLVKEQNKAIPVLSKEI